MEIILIPVIIVAVMLVLGAVALAPIWVNNTDPETLQKAGVILPD